MIKEHLLALDASTTSTGWAIYDLQNYEFLESGSITPKGGEYRKNFLARAICMKDEIAKLKETYNITIVAIEDINVVVSQKGAKNLAMADGIMLSNFTHDMINFVNVSTWRKFYKFGKMTSKEYKEFSMRLVLEKFGKDVDDNESDAILLGNYFVNTFCKKNNEEE